MAIKVNIHNSSYNQKPLLSEVRPKKESKIKIFTSDMTESNANLKEKTDNKKYLLGFGIALGVAALGIAAACIIKKLPNFLSKKNITKNCNDNLSAELEAALQNTEEKCKLPNNFPHTITNKNGIKLINVDDSYLIYDTNGKEIGSCSLDDGKSLLVTEMLDGAPDSWIVNGKLKPFLEVSSIFIHSKKGDGRKTMQAIYELSTKLGYEGRIHVEQLDEANGFYTKLGFTNDGEMSRFFTPTKESLAKLYKA